MSEKSRPGRSFSHIVRTVVCARSFPCSKRPRNPRKKALTEGLRIGHGPQHNRVTRTRPVNVAFNRHLRQKAGNPLGLIVLQGLWLLHLVSRLLLLARLQRLPLFVVAFATVRPPLAEDRRIRERVDAKLALDGYIHSMRSSIEGQGLGEKMDAGEKQRIEDALRDAQTWLDAQPEADTGAWFEHILSLFMGLSLTESSNGFFCRVPKSS